MDLSQAIQTRHSTRKFSTKIPDWRDIIECVDVARYAPMAGNNFSLKFIIVKDKETIQKIAEASQQAFITQAHYVVVACTISSRTLNLYEEFGRKFLKQQAGSAIQNFLLKIQEKGLSTCWIGYFAENIIKILLKIPDEVEVEAMFPIGYESKAKGTKPSLKKKIDINNILYFEKYGNKKMRKMPEMNV